MNPRLRQFGTALALLLATSVSAPIFAAPAVVAGHAAPAAGRHRTIAPVVRRPVRVTKSAGTGTASAVISPGLSVQRGAADTGSGNGLQFVVGPGVSVEKQTAVGGDTNSTLFAVSPGVSVEKLTAGSTGSSGSTENVISPGVSVEKLTADGGGNIESSLFAVSPGVSVQKLTAAGGGPTDNLLYVVSPGVSVQRVAVGGYTLTTLITTGPAEGATVCTSSPVFTFAASSTDPSPSFVFVYRADGGAWQGPVQGPSVLLGPLADGAHFFEVAAIDELGNEDPNPAARHFTVDTQLPALSLVAAAPTITGATITWTTDKPANSLVEYRLKNALLWTKTPLYTDLVTAHSVTFTGLVPKTVYEYQAVSADACGQQTLSDIKTFTTLPDTPPTTTLTSGPADSATVCDSTETFTFSGSDAATPTGQLRYQYRLDGSLWSAPMLTTTVTYTGLTDGLNTFEVAAVNQFGDVDPHPVKHTFTVDAAPPILSAITLGTVTATTAVITWTTDKPTTSQVDYRVSGTTDWTSTALDSALVTAHSVAISGLPVGAVYDYRVRSGDACNQAVVSAVQTFATQNPVPTTTSLSPASALVGTNSLVLTVNGSGFIAGSTVTFGALTGLVPIAGTLTPTQLQVTVPGSALTTAGVVSVTVVNPVPGGGTSNTAAFTVLNPVPQISALSPSAGFAGGPGFPLTLTGTGFVAGVTVQFGTDILTPNSGSESATQLTVTVPAADIAKTGPVSVTVINPAPGGGASNALSFAVNNPVPTLTSLTPGVFLVGATGQTLTLHGTGFVAGVTVTLGTTTGLIPVAGSLTATQLQVTIPDSLLSTAGTVSITVTDPAPGGGTSNTLSFTVQVPAPVAPTLQSAAPGDGLVSLTFTTVANAATYTLKSATQSGGPYTTDVTGITATAGAGTVTTTDPNQPNGAPRYYVVSAVGPGGESPNSNELSTTPQHINLPPAITLTAPADGTFLTAPAAVTLSATASDSDGTVTQVEFFQNGVSIGVVKTAPYTLSLSSLAAGSYPFQAIATDNSGATTPSNNVTVTVSNPAPGVTILTGPADQSTICTGTVVFTWSGYSSATPPGQLRYQYQIDGGAWSTSAPDTTATLGSLAAGLHTFTLQALNSDGSIVATPVGRSFFVNLTPPTLLSATVDTRDTRAIVNWSTSKPTTGQIEFGTTTAYGQSAPADTVSDGAHSTPLAGLTPQTTYHYRIHFTDVCHDVVSSDQTFTTTAPLIPNLSVTSLTFPNPVTTQSQTTISWNVLDSGPGDAAGTWTDSVYLSPTPTLNLATAALLGAFPAPTSLQFGEQYAQSQSVTLPNAAPGNYYVIVVTNSDHTLTETTAADDALAMPIVFLRKQTLIATPDQIPLTLTINAPQTVTLNLSDLSDMPMTGLTATVIGASPNIHIQVTAPTSLAAMMGDRAQITVTATDASVLSDTVIVNLADQQGDTAQATLSLTVAPNKPALTALPSPISQGMVRGVQTLVEVTLTNTGAATATSLNVNLPNVPWLSLASPAALGDLAPGASARIVLQLTPDSALPLGLYSGSLVVNGSNTALSIPFSFNNVSTAKGALKVVAQDEFSFFADTHPNIAGAHVLLTDVTTGATVVDGMTDANGLLSVAAVLEGSYNVTVTADNHSSYNGTIVLTAGKTNEIDPFLGRNDLVKYTFTVDPIDLQDHYVVQINAVFATNVPAPVVTISPKQLDLSQLSYDQKGQAVVNFTVTNHGLIAADDTNLTFPTRSDYQITPALGSLGKLAAMSTIVVPVTITKLGQSTGGGGTGGGGTGGGGTGGGGTGGAESCEFSGNFKYAYLCGQSEIQRNDAVNVTTGACPQQNPLGLVSNIPVQVSIALANAIVDAVPNIPNLFPTSNGPTSPVSQASFCDPCMIKKIEATAKCLASFVSLECELTIVKNTAFCGEGLYSDSKSGKGIKTKTIVGCLLGGLGSVVKCATKGPTLIGSLIRAASCAYNIAAACDSSVIFKPNFSVSGSSHQTYNLATPQAQTLTPATARLITEADRLTKMSGGYIALFGDSNWLNGLPEDARIFTTFLSEFDTAIDPSNSSGSEISGAEKTRLLSLPLPRQLTSADVYKLIDRWNRSLDYYNQQIYTVAEVPKGQSTDFIAIDQFSAASSASLDAISADAADGNTLLLSGLQQAEQAVKDEILDPQNAGICAKVHIQLNQSVAITRSAFQATLILTNVQQNVDLQKVQATLKVTDQAGKDATALFGIGAPALRVVNAVDGTGTLAAGLTGTAQWNIVPTRDAAPNGDTAYYVSGQISYTQNGTQITIPLFPTGITVRPDPFLQMHYFLQRDVYADDPFTPQIEPSEPFALGLLVKNTGKGTAHNFTIQSAQPKIVDNQKGLLEDIKIISTQVDDVPLSPSLKVSFADILPGAAGVARFLLTSSLSGKFISYDASFKHVDDLGNPRTSLIDSLTIHALEHVVRVVDPTDDGKPDFLADDIADKDNLPDTLWNSDGTTAPVTPVLNGSVDAVISNASLTAHLSVPDAPTGFVYIRLDDPGQNNYQLASVTRSDGKVISLGDDAWTTHRIIRLQGQAPYAQNRLYIFDDNSTGAYTLNYQPPTPIPPVVQLTSPHNGDTFNPNTTVSVAATATSIQAVIKELDFYDGSTLIGSSLTFPFTVPYLPTVGPHSLLAVATDANGTTGASAPVNITVNSLVTPPPTVQITGPVDGTSLFAPATVTVSATASEVGGAIAKVDFYSNGSFLGSAGNTPYTLTLENLPAGTDTFTAVATDTQGKTTTSAPVTLEIEPSLTNTGAALLRVVSAARQATPGEMMVTVQNSGGTDAVNLTLLAARTRWGSQSPTSITPTTVPMLAPNSSVTFLLQFPVGASGTFLTVGGTHSGRSFGTMTRITP